MNTKLKKNQKLFLKRLLQADEQFSIPKNHGQCKKA